MRWLAVLAVLILATGGGVGWLYLQYNAPGPLTATKTVIVPHGSLEEIAASLAHEGVVAQPLVFRALALATFRDGPLHAAELAFPVNASLRHVLTILRTARPVQHRVTIPEGLTAAQVAVVFDGAEAMAGTAKPPPEGSILPDTYSFERGTAREQVLDRARIAMDRALQTAWDARAPGLPLATKAEALILASIVERETGRAAERPIVAAVFLNRLRQGMKLQSDPTVVYGASGGVGVLGHGITRAELDRDDPYNTYRIPGLPPAPICMPGLAALRAVTQPAGSDALFFVADGTGGHAFARTQDDHLRNVAHWRDIERGREVERGRAQGRTQEVPH